MIGALLALMLALPPSGPEEIHFSPHGGCEQAVVNVINAAQAKLDIAVYSVNSPNIIKALECAKTRGVAIRILIDTTQAGLNSDVTLALVKEGFDLRLHSVGKIMHNKFVISDNQVETGSFNWTLTAEDANEENCVILTNDPIALAAYNTRFSNHLWIVNTQAKSDAHLAHIHPKIPKIKRGHIKL